MINEKTRRATRKNLFGKRWVSKKVNYEYADCDIDLVWTLATAMQMAKQGRNDAFNFDCLFNAWIKGKYCYVIPYVANCVKLNKELPKWCQDYSFWDNSDPSKEVSAREWYQRRIIWDELTDDWDKYRLTRVTLELKEPFNIGFQTLLQTMNGDAEWRNRISVAASSLFSQMEEERMAKMDKRTIKMS